MLYIFVVTQNRVTTRIQVGCEEFADSFRNHLKALGYVVSQVYRTEKAPERSENEQYRAQQYLGIVFRQTRRNIH